MSEQPNHFSLLIGQIWSAYKKQFTRIEVPAKTDLLKEGETAQKMFFIETGSVRVWHNHNGRDITCQFFFENNMVSSIESFKKDIVSPITIQTIEACVIWWIDKREMKKIIEEMKEVPQLRDMLVDALFERTFDYIKHFTTYILNTPEQRYLQVLRDRPELVQRIPQHYIASYLGITSVHLSRIKNKLAKGK
ncbi:Crp/Fnr family transcriptional regulator [Chitinophaga sp. S165]|uniref:Crp/Fnr family transcriptional regulator n=1 Tax=Chitinophaga sp. S165 TaxID=2135462 RepID=UPI000D7090F9|nr:Crp/Fnr family transcriptional regulator [Chitinophaga sp. S165]PWV48896.1 CRP-like cAMP-binding protein [Chitinophaga sp. S165]